MLWFNIRPKLGLTLQCLAQVLTEFMASSTVGETQQLINATIAHKEQTLPSDKVKVVGMQLGVEFG